ncbi:MAG: leucyl/phenylalanyl-tRNA--protein transferase [Spirochaetes bacterium]|jgi:leucyl/phenylalanyl-tRNA--protein transferase|nr:leucyl/phenylalanyl-tRNA--protein transferase [Spirochaetota bacterium]
MIDNSTSIFPHPDESDEYGLLCYGGSLKVEILIDAYSHGIFPWPHEGYPLLWFSPPERGIIEFDSLHIPERLARFRRTWKGEFRFDTNFREVIVSCANKKRRGQRGTWITEEIINGYLSFHNAGYAHCIEAWEGNDLAGGIYGVFVGNVFSAESMFFNRPNCSKLCLWRLIEHLQGIGSTWLDVQVLTPATEQFGGIYITREEFLKRIRKEHEKKPISFL